PPPGPLCAVPLRRLLVERGERMVRDLLNAPGMRRRQLDLKRLGVERLDADLVAQCVAVRLARVVGLGADDAEELVRVVRGALRRDRPLPGVLEVVRGPGVAVPPAPVCAELERDGLPAVALLPALRESRHRLEVVAELDQ